MKENTDPHQIVISREYFDKLIALARDNDHTARRPNHPNQTILARIQWHARKYNPAYKLEQAQERFADQQRYKADKERALEFAKKYQGKVITFIFINDLTSALVIGVSKHDKTRIQCKRLFQSKPVTSLEKLAAKRFKNLYLIPPKFFFYEIKRQQ